MGDKFDEMLFSDIATLVRVGAYIIAMGAFIRVFLFGDNSWFGALLLALTIGVLFPVPRTKKRRKINHEI